MATASLTAHAPARPTLAELEARDEFVHRHIGTDAEATAAMLAAIGYPSLEAMMTAAIPPAIRRATPLVLPPPRPEAEALAALRRIASRNKIYRSVIGQGYYGTRMPAVIQRNVLENPAWYTAYTPYQAEISQGRLEALLNFQQMIIDLTAMEIANASLLDEATAAAEAMTLLRRANPAPAPVFFVADDVLPQTLAVIRTRAQPLHIEVRTGPAADAARCEGFGVLLQYPGSDGEVRDYRALVAAIHARGGLVAVAADLLALTLLVPPGEWGADTVLGSTQRFGVAPGYGGPHAAYLATREACKRQLPGRLVGVTRDAHGNPAYRLALQAREQHIRRETATSNICTAQVLPAILAAMYAVYHGPLGLIRIARRIHRLTTILAAGLREMEIAVANPTCFDTLTLTAGARTAEIHERARAHAFNLRWVSDTALGITLDELSTRDEVVLLWSICAPAGATLPDFAAIEAHAGDGFDAALARTSHFLTHPVFNRYHSEHEMLRYLRALADRDLALDRGMIPLGSCTMKLNATSEMLPLTWPEFADLHPFVPPDQALGYQEMIDGLARKLCAISGYSAISFQPNAGSQGEYAGLLMIRAYHASRGESGRRACLIPASAHGTNPASAQLAGLDVVVVACDAAGNIDVADLERKAAAHSATLAAIMITYPSTHGVFEPALPRICEIVHQHGGQVYIDGANMNAMVGWCAPGEFGGDVSHFNLHKTFCIPHGGGGPGVGAVAVAAHLAPFLPRHGSGEASAADATLAIGPVAAAPHGSASILPICWMYLTLMGASGLTAASAHAVLAANYCAARLDAHYSVLYRGPAGLVAHECIIDLRPLKEATGISNEDVAKRLIDFGFHAPTMSFPVPGTLMIEPTESEAKTELDRFIAAMLAIRAEIGEIERGELDATDNPLKHAPHPAAALLVEPWPHAYTRERAAYPLAGMRQRKYWPPVGRADNTYGDRNLFCACLPPGDVAG